MDIKKEVATVETQQQALDAFIKRMDVDDPGDRWELKVRQAMLENRRQTA